VRAQVQISLERTIHRRWGDVIWSLRQDPGGLVNAATRSPTGRMYIKVAGFEVSRALRLRVGPVTIKEQEARLRVDWEAQSRPGLFPIMRGQLVAVPSGRHETWIGLSGQYQPPLGPVGRLLNRVVGFHVAHAAMDGFLGDVARHLETDHLRGD
jgi:hypothetical protein